jgi:methyl-accepting chemotaxis protein
MRQWKQLFVKPLSNKYENTIMPDPETSPKKLIMPDTRKKSSHQFDHIAQAAMQLASLGPNLARLAVEMEKQAQLQAGQAADIAGVMVGFTDDLDHAVKELRASSGQVENALETVSRIAEHTRIISINAGIEAVRAGEHGRAFSVVVEEVQRLADRTGETTNVITDCIRGMQQSIMQVAIVAGSDETADGSKQNTVEVVNRQVLGMVRSVEEQLGSAEGLHRLVDQINGQTERLLLALGTFRFEAHHQAESEVAKMLPLLGIHIGDRQRCEELFEKWLGEHPSFELIYLTDGRGRQYIDNITWRDGRIVHDPAGYGRDWSRRPWYLDAVRNEGIRSTDIYRSTATGDFCFTVTGALRGAGTGEKALGVIGADVSFRRLLEC